ncbi:ParA family protein [Pseudomonas syringae]|uniref:Cobyrinic acid a,c-diamide synthase n=5 Tax=Pseudomonas syringae TaxID=317 RepID=Q4ZW69_PSEU2|nr:AAA family ATPase [Pseudomonas syringae]AAY36603.1 Cobyrinic acid a,c-diamide synthase [Pseudomonas syringae pv. syringae B728a]MBI6771132.1 AAA family ATPase [Pseudomonas syringae]MBI6778927.1 AAA family ATPase [Pseudomonas syringae]MBI6802911.1 AAA family ATPase [Pseudomonas syringae]MDC3734334.1 AAA family ATPase [Pseudomonas syringae pv. syringae]
MPKVISMINWKGGVGKTTLTLHLAAGLASRHHKRVLLIDLDPQCNLSFLAIGANSYVTHTYKKNLPTLKTIFDGYFDRAPANPSEVILTKRVRASAGKVFTQVDIILSHQELTLLDMKLAREKRSGKDHREETKFEIEKISIIKDIIDAVSDNYDYVLLDCPPNVNLVTQSAFFASDYYIVPAIPDFLSTVGIAMINQYMDQFNKDYQSMWNYSGLPASYASTKFGGIIFNMVNEYGSGPKKGHAKIIKNVKTELGSTSVFSNYVTDGDGISTASEMNLPVFAFNDLPRAQQNASKQADYLASVIDEFVTRIL